MLLTPRIAQNFYYSGAGQFYMGERGEDGRPTCLHAVGNVSEATLSFDIQTDDHRSSQDCGRSVDFRNTTEIAANMALTLESLNSDNLALAMYGQNETLAAGTTSENINFQELGCWYPLEHVGLDAATPATVDTLTEDTDFEVDYTGGLVRLLPDGGGAIGELPVEYAHPEQQRIEGLTNTTPPERFLRFVGLNTAADCTPVVIDVYRVSVGPLTNLPLINTDIAQMPVSLGILLDPTRTTGSPYFTVRKLDVPTT